MSNHPPKNLAIKAEDRKAKEYFGSQEALREGEVAEGGFEEVIGKNKDKARGQGSGFSAAKTHLITMLKAIVTKRERVEESALEIETEEIDEELDALMQHLPLRRRKEAIKKIEEIVAEIQRVAALMQKNKSVTQVIEKSDEILELDEEEKELEEEGSKGLTSILGKSFGANILNLVDEKSSKGRGGKQSGNNKLGELSPDAPKIAMPPKAVALG